jgi:beta-galactosidase
VAPELAARRWHLAAVVPLLVMSLLLGCSRRGAVKVLLTTTTGSGGSASQGVPGPHLRSDEVLGGNWRYIAGDAAGAEQPSFDDTGEAWQSVRVPHTWNALDGQDGGSDYRRGPGWYRLRFRAPAPPAGRRTYLQFDAANTVADAYLNGQRLGQHRGGYAGFRFDATAALAAGENLLAVRVDNSPVPDVAPLDASFTFFGGLYRDVHLLEVNDVHIDLDDAGGPGLYLDASNVSATSAEVRGRVRVTNASLSATRVRVILDLADETGGPVASYSTDLALALGETGEVLLGGLLQAPHLWDGRADPYLYRARARVEQDERVLDALEQSFGIRAFAIDPNRGLVLNGRPLELRGVNRHQDRLDLGWALGAAHHEEDLALILELGANAVRLAHYQHSQYFYELCDRAGLVVWAEIPLVNALTDSAAFRDNAEQQLRELVRQSQNHPSIFFWGIGNEQRTDDAPTNALLGDLAEQVRREDPSRLSAYAHCCEDDTGGLPEHADVSGYNEYFGWYRGELQDIGKWADALHAARPAARLALTEYGAGASLVQHQDPPRRPRTRSRFHPEEYQTLFHEAYWTELSTRPYLWGKFVWSMFDFADDDRDEGDTPGRNDKGLVSYDRATRKDAFYWYKANWSSEPLVHVNGKRFEPRTTNSVDLKVYSNLPRVRLRMNGTDLGELAGTGHIFRRSALALQPGANLVEAVGMTADGATVAMDSVTWTAPGT